jgi:hypothetical protein
LEALHSEHLRDRTLRSTIFPRRPSRSRTTLTEFLRSFRKAREAADRGDSVIVKGENGDYVFERRAASSDSAAASPKRTVIVDAGALKAAIAGFRRRLRRGARPQL